MNPASQQVIRVMSEHPGNLNYCLATMVDGYINAKGVSYGTYNDVVGVLECLKMELYRRFVGPYEDKKLKENGDVFTVNG